MSNLVSTEWLATHINDANLVVLDSTWHLPTLKRNAHEEFIAAHIKGSRFFDIDQTSDRTSPLPHMLPTAEQFSAQMSALGIGNDSHIVVYDSYGLFSAARCWWMFKIFGHDKVSVLNGGLKKWLAEGREIKTGESSPAKPTLFTANLNAKMLRSMEEVAQTKAQVADARSATRFRGEEPEPRAGVRPGHIPNARNVHYASLLAADGTMRPKTDLAAKFSDAGIDTAKPIITSCGSGVTAAILTLALAELGAKDVALYDGSWA
ncbi:MAG: 3-mercaptopyruvate sulfurtransferase, partial [Aestuariivirga sp.]